MSNLDDCPHSKLYKAHKRIVYYSKNMAGYMEQQKEGNGFNEQMERIRQMTGTRTQIQLADLLGIRQSSVSDAKRRGIIPIRWLDTLRRLKNINPDWVFYGVGAQYLAPADVEQLLPHMAKITEIKPLEGCSALDLFRELVKRALKEDDLGAIGKEVAATWLPVEEKGKKS